MRAKRWRETSWKINKAYHRLVQIFRQYWITVNDTLDS